MLPVSQETVPGTRRRAGSARTGSPRAALGPAAALPHRRYGKSGDLCSSLAMVCTPSSDTTSLTWVYLNKLPLLPPVTAVKPKPRFTLPVRAAPQGRRRRLSAVPPCPLSRWGAARGERDSRDNPLYQKRSAVEKQCPQPLATFPQCGRKRLGRAQGGPRRAGCGENEHPARSGAPQAAWGQRVRPGAPPLLGHARPSGAQPHAPGQAVRLRLSPTQRTRSGGARGAGIPPPSPPAIPAPWHYSSPYMDTRMSDVISTLGNQRPRNQAWLGRRVVRERRGVEGKEALECWWTRRCATGSGGPGLAIGQGGRRRESRAGRVVALEKPPPRWGAAPVWGGRCHRVAGGQRVRVPPPRAGSRFSVCRTPLRGEGSLEWAFGFLFFLLFLLARRPRLSLWGASPQGQSLPGVCAEFGPRPPTRRRHARLPHAHHREHPGAGGPADLPPGHHARGGGGGRQGHPGPDCPCVGRAGRCKQPGAGE